MRTSSPGLPTPSMKPSASTGSYDLTGYAKLGEIPYDFNRKRLSVLVSEPAGARRMITKGALTNVLEVCASARLEDGNVVALENQMDSINRLFSDLSGQGYQSSRGGIADPLTDSRSR